MNDKRLEEAIRLIKQGDKRNGGMLLQEFVKENPNSETAWLWLAYCVIKKEQKRYCLGKALKINPNNLQARQAFEQLELEVPPPNTGLLPKSVGTKDDRRFDKVAPKKSNKNWSQILLAGSIFILSLSVCAVAFFVIFIKDNSSPTIPLAVISTPTDSPEKLYVSKMSQNMILLDSFNNTLTAWDSLMITVIPGYQDLTYGQALDLFPKMIYTSQLSKQAGLSYEFDPYIRDTQVNVIPVAQGISSEGFAFLTAWHSVTPPPELKLPHEQIESCVQYKVDLANDIIKMLEQYIIPTRELGADPCGNFINSISAISAYLINHSK